MWSINSMRKTLTLTYAILPVPMNGSYIHLPGEDYLFKRKLSYFPWYRKEYLPGFDWPLTVKSLLPCWYYQNRHVFLHRIHQPAASLILQLSMLLYELYLRSWHKNGRTNLPKKISSKWLSFSRRFRGEPLGTAVRLSSILGFRFLSSRATEYVGYANLHSSKQAIVISGLFISIFPRKSMYEKLSITSRCLLCGMVWLKPVTLNLNDVSGMYFSQRCLFEQFMLWTWSYVSPRA